MLFVLVLSCLNKIRGDFYNIWASSCKQMSQNIYSLTNNIYNRYCSLKLTSPDLLGTVSYQSTLKCSKHSKIIRQAHIWTIHWFNWSATYYAQINYFFFKQQTIQNTKTSFDLKRTSNKLTTMTRWMFELFSINSLHFTCVTLVAVLWNTFGT